MNKTGPKVKISRQLGVPLTPKAARVMEKKPHPPGEHGRAPNFRRKLSDYKRQLVEKQKLRAQYNIHEQQLRNYFDKAQHKKGNTGDNLVQMLEMRLDALVLRGGLARTIYAARQLVTHGHMLVNGQRVDVPGYTAKVGDVISVRPKSQQLPAIQEAMAEAQPVPYLSLDRNAASVTVLAVPSREIIPVICDVPLVIEYYSR
ncbi:MAG: 30S ribosomal protein S4 [Caldilineaceae bacterium]|nr:30S ribosomal protein S4 [Caldilineaceae bacterium]